MSDVLLTKKELDAHLYKVLEDAILILPMKGLGLRYQILLMENDQGGTIRMTLHQSLLLEIMLSKMTRSILIEDMDSSANPLITEDGSISMQNRSVKYFKFINIEDIADHLSRLFTAFEDRTQAPIPSIFWDFLPS